MSDGGWPVFVGREREIADLSEALRRSRAGNARIIGVEGAAGIGKTALLRRFLDDAGVAGAIWVSGDEAEASLPWGVLGQIAAALPGEDLAPCAGHDPVAVGQSLARRLRADLPLVLVVDDAHWADRLSMTALRVAARRLVNDPVLVVVSYQPAGLDEAWRRLFESERGAYLRVVGLDARELVRLAAACGHPGLSPSGAARLVEHTGGHPMHVRHLLDELPMHSIVFGQGALPAPRNVSAAIRPRLLRCSRPARDLVAAGAVLGRRFRLAPVRALADLEDCGEAVAEAIDAGILEEAPGSAGQELIFTSTLVRGLVYHDLDRRTRQDLHRRAAELGGYGHLWHRIAAADGPDERLAADIAQMAHEHLARGQIPFAAAYLRHALDLTPPGPQRAPRLLTAVESLLVAGDIGTALHYAPEVAAGGPDAWFDYVAGYQLLLMGQVAEAQARLRRALVGPALDGSPPDLRARVATQLTIIGVLAQSHSDVITYGQMAVTAAREPWVTTFAWFAWAIGLAAAGRGDQALAELATVDGAGAPAGLDGLVARGMIRLWTDDLAGAVRDLDSAVHRATRGEVLRIGQALGFLGEAQYRRGAVAEAVLHTEVALADAQENDRVWDYAMLHALASYPLAAQAQWDRARAHAEQSAAWARQHPTPTAILYAAASQAMIAQARGDAAALLDAAEQADHFYPTAEPGGHPLVALHADALSRMGRLVEAQAALERFSHRLGPKRRPSIAAGLARVRAQIAAAAGRPEEAVAACEEALRLARGSGLRLDAARVELLLGEYRAMAGRRAAGERALRSAARECAAMGATAYLDQARQVADRVGVNLDEPPAALGLLTPSERAVAALVCRGLSNREVAVQLVISPKTVEFHLTNVFRRLDVATRAELREVALDLDWPAGGPEAARVVGPNSQG